MHFFKGRRRIHHPRVVEIPVNETVEGVAEIQAANPAGAIGIADDVDRATVAQQMVKFRLVRQFIDPFQLNQQKLARLFG